MKVKNCRFIAALLLCTLTATAQNAGKILLFDMAHVTGDSFRAISLKGEDMGFVQVVFTSLSCDTSRLKIGYSLTDSLVVYPSSISGLDQPITLNKLTVDPSDSTDYLFTHTINNKTNSVLGINISNWRPYYMVFTIKKPCNSGKIYLIHRR